MKVNRLLQQTLRMLTVMSFSASYNKVIFTNQQPSSNHFNNNEKFKQNIQALQTLTQKIQKKQQIKNEQQKPVQLNKAIKQQTKQQQDEVFKTQDTKPIIKEKENIAYISNQIQSNLKKYLQMIGVKIQVDNSLPQNTIFLQNVDGQTKKLDIINEPHTIFKLSNFFNPINVFKSPQQVSLFLKQLKDDQYLIVAYIPTFNQYRLSKNPKSKFDSFTSDQYLDVKQIQSNFLQQKCSSNTRKNKFVLIRDAEIAKLLKININKIGQEYVFYKTTPNHGMQSSVLLQKQKFTVKNSQISANQPNNIVNKGLYGLVNQITYQGDLQEFLRSRQLSKDNKKLFVIYSKQKRPEFIKQLTSILTKSAKMTKDDAIVVMINNQQLVGKYFQIVPDQFVTVRLFDFHKIQPPIIQFAHLKQKTNKHYSRTTMKGPFTVENVCKFIKNKSQWKQYYESKRINSIPSIVSMPKVQNKNTLILHWKRGCKGCQITMNYMQKIKQIIQKLDENSALQFQIENPNQFKQVNFQKFNILNEQSNQKQSADHDITPKLILATGGKFKDLNIGQILSKLSAINYSNENQIHKDIIKRLISAIEQNLEQNTMNQK